MKYIAKYIFLLLIICIHLYSDNTNYLKIRKIQFSGNKIISSEALSKKLLFKSGSLVTADDIYNSVESIKQTYLENKILFFKIFNPEIAPVSSNIIDIFYLIEENAGLQTDLKINGNVYLSENFLRSKIPLLNAKEKSSEDLNICVQELLDLYMSSGFFFAEIALDSLGYSGNVLNAYININENKPCRFTKFSFQGNKVTKPETLLKISGIKHVNKFDLQILNQLEENINKKDYISDCSLIPLDSETLLFSITEDRMTLLSGLAGYDNSSDETSLTGFLRLKFNNLFGTDRSFGFYWSHLKTDRSIVELNYYDSGPNKYPIGAELLLSREEADSTYIRTIADLKLFYYSLNSKYGIYTGISSYYPGSRRPILIEKYNQKKAGVFFDYTNTDNHYNPGKGYDFDLLYYWIFEKDSTASDIRNAVEMSLGTYFPLYRRFVLASIFNFKNQSFKDNNHHEYYFLGGATTLRGFTEDRFSGYRICWINNEIRYILNRKSRFFFFCDYGYLEMEESGERKTLNDLFGVGIGLRYQTRIGLLGVDYGFGSSNGTMNNPWDGIVHFNIETGF